MGTGNMRVLTRQVIACLVGLAVGAAAFVFVADPYSILAAGVLGLAGTLALWPPSGDRHTAARWEIRLIGRRRVRELEAEVARLSAALDRGTLHRVHLVGALRGLDEWAAAHEPVPQLPQPPSQPTTSSGEEEQHGDESADRLWTAALGAR